MKPPQSRSRRKLRIGMLAASEYDSHPRIRRQAEALVARGDHVTVLALHAEGRPKIEEIDGVHVVHLPVRKYRGDSARTYMSLYGRYAAHAMARMSLRPRAFDVIQVNTMPEALVFCALAPRLARVPLLLDVHDRTVELFMSKFTDGGRVMSAVRFSERASLRFATEVLTVHEPYAQTLRQLTRKRVSVVMNCPDERIFAPRVPRQRRPGDEVTFGYHGLIAPRHGLTNAVEALAGVRTAVPGARMRILGSGDGLDALRAKVTELGLADVVELPERVLPVSRIPAELERVDVGIVPSQRDAWTDRVLPTKLLEYAVLGIPVITFRNPVIEECFGDDAVTYVDPASPERLREAMLTLIRDPERARAQAERAREVMTRLTWSEQKLAYFEVIDRLAGRGRRGNPAIPRQRSNDPQ